MPVNERLDLPAQVLGLRVLPDPGVPGELEDAPQKGQGQVVAQGLAARAVLQQVAVHHIHQKHQVLRLLPRVEEGRGPVGGEGIFPQSRQTQPGDGRAVGGDGVFLAGKLVVDHAAVVKEQVPGLHLIKGLPHQEAPLSPADQQNLRQVLVGVEDAVVGPVRGQGPADVGQPGHGLRREKGARLPFYKAQNPFVRHRVLLPSPTGAQDVIKPAAPPRPGQGLPREIPARY